MTLIQLLLVCLQLLIIGSLDSPRLFLRPIYHNVLLDEFACHDKLPFGSIPLDSIMDGETGVKKDWILSGVLPAIWEIVDNSYKAWSVPLPSNFHILFPSKSPEDLDELNDLVAFSTLDKSIKLASFDKLRSYLADAHGNSRGTDLHLNVIFANALTPAIYQDLSNSSTIKEYLVLQDLDSCSE